MAGKGDKNVIDLDLVLIEDNFVILNFTFLDMLESIGGIGVAIYAIISQLSVVFLVVYLIDMIRVIFSRYKFNYIRFRNQELLQGQDKHK